MSDPEVEKINQKKLKDKGAKIVEERKDLNYEGIVMQLSQYLNDMGLEMMNTATELRKVIANDRQAKRNQQIEEKKA